ncbi:hypothetical protein BVRB_6g136380 [Beta vulgaris subsp. vulgaris]|nr:hypothetical protein BVRB_6g136380 [Beta vulgaris subsp. vulgaris]
MHNFILMLPEMRTSKTNSVLADMHNRISCANGETEIGVNRSVAEICFIGAVLQLRETKPVAQPLVDASGNILIYNACPSVLRCLQDLVVWQECDWEKEPSCSLAHFRDSRLIFSSISPPASTSQRPGFQLASLNCGLIVNPNRSSSTSHLYHVMLIIINSLDPEVEGRESNINYWEELLCGVYSIDIDASRAGACLSGKVRKHEGMNSMLKDLIAWERKLIEPKHVELKTFSSSLLLGKPDLLSASDSGML